MGTRAPIRAGIIGRGMAGTVFHMPLLRAVDDIALVAMEGSDGAAGLIADPAIDLIVIATPNPSHFPLADAALKAGKHVVIDKPLAVTSADADALIDRARRQGRVLSVFHNRRWDGDFLTVRDLIASGRLGDVLLYEAHWDRFRPAIKQGWRETAIAGSGLLWDLGSHLIDQAIALFGLPGEIAADVTAQREGAAADDYFCLALHYGPLRVVLGASTMAADPRPRFDIHGSAGSFRKYGVDPQEAALRDGASPLDPGFARESVDTYGWLTGATGEAERIATRRGRYLAFYEAMAAAIRGDGPPPVDPGEARDVVRLIELASKSAAAGKRLRW